MFENIATFFKNIGKKKQKEINSKDTAKERLHLVLMQDRANVSADFLDMMKQEIIEVIKKYIDVDEKDIDVRLANKQNEDGTMGAPALYANIPISGVKEGLRLPQDNKEEKTENNKDDNEENKINDKEKNNTKKEEKNEIEEVKEEVKEEEKEEEKSDIKKATEIKDNNKENQSKKASQDSKTQVKSNKSKQQSNNKSNGKKK